jgi:hypothetical protein
MNVKVTGLQYGAVVADDTRNATCNYTPINPLTNKGPRAACESSNHA